MELLRRATTLYPTSQPAWLALAGDCEELGRERWAEGERAYATLARLPGAEGLRAIAETGRARVAERRAIALLQDAEELASRGECDKALGLLADAFELAPEQHLQDRIRSRYYQVAAKAISTKILGAFPAGVRDECVVAAGADAEALAIRDAVCMHLTESRPLKARAASAPGGLERSLAKAEFDGIGQADRERLKELGSAFFLVARDEREFAAYRIETEAKKTTPLSRIRRIGPAPGRPARDVWQKLVAKARTDAEFRVQVWTDRAKYRVGEEVVFHVSATKDCYVTLIDLQASGTLALLLPNQYEPSAFVRAGQVVSIPGAKSPFTIAATGPPGIEGVKALATLRPLVVAERPADVAFFQTNRPEEQQALCQRLAEKVASLGAAEWDVGEWTFQIE